MSFVTLAVAAHVAKRSRGAAPAARRTAPLPNEKRRGRWVGWLKDAALFLVAMIAVFAVLAGIMFAEQAGIAWLSVLLQVLLFLPIIALAVGMFGICLFALASIS